MKIGIIGVGNLGSSIANGLLNSGVKKEDLVLSEYKIDLLKSFESSGATLTANNNELVQQSDIVIFALKPYKLVDILNEVKPSLKKDTIIVSVVSTLQVSLH